MSNEKFTRTVVKNIVKNTKIGVKGSEGQDRSVGHVARELLQSKLVQQCLVLDTEALTDIAWAYGLAISKEKEKNSFSKSSTRKSTYKSKLKAHISGKSAIPKLDKDETGAFFKQLVEDQGLTFGKDIFYLPETFKNIKKIIENFNREYSAKDKYDHTIFSNNINLDHGGEGVPSGVMGAALGTEVTRKRSRRELPQGEEFDKAFESNLDAILAKATNRRLAGTIRPAMLTLQMQSHQAVTRTGKLSAGMSMLVTPRRKKDNLAQAGGEAQVQKWYLEAYAMTLSPSDYINMQGSSTLMEKIEQSIVLSVTDKAAKNKRIKVKKGAKVPTKTQTKGKADSPKPKGHKVKKVRAGPIRRSGRQRTGAGQRSFFNIMAMINQKLPEVVKNNMKAPRLENQTGRFARSVKLQDVNTTPQGHPSFGYTYEKDPYQVFEVGTGKAPWATSQRDPRKLIDASIREVAGQMALGRFYTRRL